MANQEPQTSQNKPQSKGEQQQNIGIKGNQESLKNQDQKQGQGNVANFNRKEDKNSESYKRVEGEMDQEENDKDLESDEDATGKKRSGGANI